VKICKVHTEGGPAARFSWFRFGGPGTVRREIGRKTQTTRVIYVLIVLGVDLNKIVTILTIFLRVIIKITVKGN
jgi:hypothetical protein